MRRLIILKLIKEQKNKKILDDDFFNEILLTSIKMKKSLKMIKIIMDEKLNFFDIQNFDLIKSALLNNHIELVKFLFSSDIIDIMDFEDLDLIIKENNNQIVKLFLNNKKILEKSVNFDFYRTPYPLTLAIKYNNIEIIKLLLEDRRINVNFENFNHDTPLTLAIKNNNINIVKLLLKEERIDINYNNFQGFKDPIYLEDYKQ